MRVFPLPVIEKNNLTVVKSTDLYPKPLNTIGYNYFQVQTHDGISKLLLAPENVGKKFYYIMENLTSDVSYDKNIETLTTKYFGENMSNEFLQLWEIVLTFNLINSNLKVSSNDDVLKLVFDKLKKFVKVTSNKKMTHLCLLNQITFETTELEISKKITKFMNNLESLEKGGYLIIKVKELIHAPSIHLLYLLSNVFEEVYIYRPELSYISHGEKYIVCKNYKQISIKYELSNDYISLNMNLPTDYIFTVNVINRVLMQEEYIIRNKMRQFINSQNYYGDEYHNQLAIQQNNSDNWIANNLIISAKNYTELQKVKEKELNKSLEIFESFIDDKTKLVL